MDEVFVGAIQSAKLREIVCFHGPDVYHHFANSFRRIRRNQHQAKISQA